MVMAPPASEDEAEARFLQWRDRDPFPNIPPALLNSADIIDYVTVTGMVFPFNRERGGEKKLKPASYEVDILGSVKYWDEEGKEIRRNIAVGDAFVLKRNSIAFVQVEPTFRLPNYIAVRFNLKIQHVYRGILLGTGPLVDPGFKGPLYIPLHNLTDNDYTLRGGEGLIWMEFTKLNWPPPASVTAAPTTQLAEAGTTSGPERAGEFIAFPDRKLQRRTLDDYLLYANPHGSIRSSIPVAVQTARKAAERAESRVKWFAGVGIAGIVAALLGLGGFIFQSMAFVRMVRSDVVERLRIVEGQVSELREKGVPLERSSASTPRLGVGAKERDRSLPEGRKAPESGKGVPKPAVAP